MNSLNILSARVSPPQTPVPTRRNSYGYGEALGAKASHESRRSSSISGPRDDRNETPTPERDPTPSDEAGSVYDEKVPLLLNGKASERKSSSWYTIPFSFANAIWGSIRWLLSILAAPCVFLMAFMYNEKGIFSPFSQMYKLFTWGNSGQSSRPQVKSQGPSRSDSRSSTNEKLSSKGSRRLRSSNSSSSGLSSESESDRGGVNSETSSLEVPSRHTRSRSAQTSDEIAPARRSIRIKLHNEDSLRQRKHRKSQSTSSQSNGKGGADSQLISPATLKSPTSPASSLLRDKYPRAPAPPRPLIPRRQPSYSTVQDFESGRMAQKTLILDLDETLIHSMAKGGRMSTGHMVEVKLNTYVGTGGTSLGPQHPILYYVHKRPHCDDFLRRICKWYNLVVFTASVQEYADPVIDWLEQERKFFSGRYYRQHCTYRHGAFIKDLSTVEPDLSKVMILDNSPLSYMFHQDNAIPIEGWINDPTDNDLLHLVPLLEGLQYVTDVRAFLALRGGEDGKHMTS